MYSQVLGSTVTGELNNHKAKFNPCKSVTKEVN